MKKNSYWGNTHIKKLVPFFLFIILVSFDGISFAMIPSDELLHSASNNQILHVSNNHPYHLEILDEGSIMAGTSARPITPDLDDHSPIFIAGFNRNRVATGVHDDIWTRCCCTQIGNTTLAFVSVDLIGIMYSEYQRIIQTLPSDILIDLIILTSTHNHEGPDVIGLWGKTIFSGITWEWYEEAMETITETITEAYQNMQPAGFKMAHDVAKNMSRDSREPIVIEEQVETIQFVDAREQPISTMVFYASHPEILWDENTLITSDYPHYLYDQIENTVGGTALLLTGPIGGLITPKTRNHTFEGAKDFGETIATISLNSLDDSSIIWNTSIRIEHQELFIPLTNPVFRIASIINVLNRPLYHLRRDVLTSVSVIELGSDASLAQIITVPGEDFPENWFEIKEKMHATHRIHIGLATDELGYIVPIEAYNPKDYEESMSASKYLDPLVHNSLENMLTIN